MTSGKRNLTRHTESAVPTERATPRAGHITGERRHIRKGQPLRSCPLPRLIKAVSIWSTALIIIPSFANFTSLHCVE